MKGLESWATERPWGIDVFATVSCSCGRKSGHSAGVMSAYMPDGGHVVAVVDCPCPELGCDEATEYRVNVVDALKRGEGRTPDMAREGD